MAEDFRAGIGDVFTFLPFSIKVSPADYRTLRAAEAEEDVTVTDQITGGVLTVRYSECGLCDSRRCAVVLVRWVKQGTLPEYQENIAHHLLRKGYREGLAEHEKGIARFVATLSEYGCVASGLLEVAAK